MNQDICYCSGIACALRDSCRRYLPSPVNKRLMWVNPRYEPSTGECFLYLPMKQGF